MAQHGSDQSGGRGATRAASSGEGGERGHGQRNSNDGQADESGGGIMGWFGGGKKAVPAPRETVVKLPQVPETMRRPVDSPSDRERIETEIISACIIMSSVSFDFL